MAVYVHVWTYTHIHICNYMYIYICIYVCVYMCICTCINRYMYIHVSIAVEELERYGRSALADLVGCLLLGH